MKRLILLSAAALLAACGNATTETRDVNADDSVSTTEVSVNGATTVSITLRDGYIMAPLKGRDVAAGYFQTTNDGPDAAIVSATSPVAEVVELHTHSMDEGVMKMREVERIDLPSGETVEFRPGGLHLMMFGFAREEGQSETPVTLTLDNGETLTVTLPIRERE
ncbi:MAG: copper chaperone PCu(A)C [Litorimonas sp.]